MKDERELLNKLTKRTIEYISKDLAMNEVEETFEIANEESLQLLDISTQIKLSGYMEGSIVLSISNTLAIELAKNSIFGELEESLLQELAGENTAEILNIVLGNVLMQLEGVKDGKSLEISAPKTTQNSYVIKKEKELLFSVLNYKNENIILGYFR